MSNGDQLSQGGQELLPENQSFSEVVKNKIDRLPIPVQQVDPNAPERRSFGIPIERRFDYSYSGNGQVRFGKMFETRQIWVQGLEVTLAWNKKTEKSEVLVHQFDDRGLATRTWFKEQEDGRIAKTYQLAPWGNGLFGGGPQIHRVLEEDEVNAINAIISDPEQRVESYYDFVIPSLAEKAALEDDRQETQARKEEFKAKLDQIDKMHRYAFEDSQNVFFG